MKKKMSFGFATIFLMLIACRKKEPEPDLNCNSPTKNQNISCNSPTNDTTIAKDLIIGQWRLERTSIAYRGKGIVTMTRDQLPYTILTLCKDQTYQCYVADTLSCKGKYEFIHDTGDDLIIFYNGNRPFLEFAVGPFEICNDSLFTYFNSRSDGNPNEFWSRK
jgi:hypothetical protein